MKNGGQQKCLDKALQYSLTCLRAEWHQRCQWKLPFFYAEYLGQPDHMEF